MDFTQLLRRRARFDKEIFSLHFRGGEKAYQITHDITYNMNTNSGVIIVL